MADLLSRQGPELTPAELYGLLRLRVGVFVVEQECPYQEIDGKDLLPGTRHIWYPGAGGTGGEAGGIEDIDGCLRVLEEPGGVLRIGRVCTSAAARGTGLGARLMRAALDYAGDVECVLDAQTYAQAFYARFGFRPEGEEFDEDGIPHIRMHKPSVH